MFILIITPKHMKFQSPKSIDQRGSNFLFALPMKMLKKSQSKVGYFRTIAEIFRNIYPKTPICPKNSKSTRFLSVFIILEMYNFVLL